MPRDKRKGWKSKVRTCPAPGCHKLLTKSHLCGEAKQKAMDRNEAAIMGNSRIVNEMKKRQEKIREDD